MSEISNTSLHSAIKFLAKNVIDSHRKTLSNLISPKISSFYRRLLKKIFESSIVTEVEILPQARGTGKKEKQMVYFEEIFFGKNLSHETYILAKVFP